MTKLIICVKSCHRDLDSGFHDIIRSTWGKVAAQNGVMVRFFMGKDPLMESERRMRQYKSDEVVVDCRDDYMNLPFKTRGICRWAQGKLTDHIFLCDTDTYVGMKYLLTCHFEEYDFLGQMCRQLGKTFRYTDVDTEGNQQLYERCYTWASGGMGYFLSRKAAGYVAEAHPNIWAEDMWVGQVVGPVAAEGELTCMNTASNLYTGNQYAWHYPQHSKGGQAPDAVLLKAWMAEMYGKWQ